MAWTRESSPVRGPHTSTGAKSSIHYNARVCISRGQSLTGILWRLVFPMQIFQRTVQQWQKCWRIASLSWQDDGRTNAANQCSFKWSFFLKRTFVLLKGGWWNSRKASIGTMFHCPLGSDLTKDPPAIQNSWVFPNTSENESMSPKKGPSEKESPRWAHTSYKWRNIPEKWPYKWLTGVITYL